MKLQCEMHLCFEYHIVISLALLDGIWRCFGIIYFQHEIFVYNHFYYVMIVKI